MAISHIASDWELDLLTPDPGGTDNLIASKPGGTAEDDVMIMVATGSADQNGSPYTFSINTPSGWTRIDDLNYNSFISNYYQHQTAIFRKVAGSSEPSTYNVPYYGTPGWGTATITGVVTVSTFRGVDPNDPIGDDENQTNTATTNHTAPSINVSKANNWVVHCVSIMDNVAVTPPGGSPTYTERVEGPNSIGLGVNAELSSAVYTSSGATGTKTATTGTSEVGHAFHIELNQIPPELTMELIDYVYYDV